MLNVKFLKGTLAEYTAATKDANAFYFVDDKDLYLGSVKLTNNDELNAAINRIAANETNIGTMGDLKTTANANLVAAINEIRTELNTLIGGESGEGAVSGISGMIEAVTGDLEGLNTTKKGTLVEAINEVNTTAGTAKTTADSAVSKADAAQSSADAAKDAADAAQADVDTLEGKIGIEALGTDATTISGAIAELASEVTADKAAAKVTVDTTTTTEGMSKSYTIKQGGTAITTIDIPKDMVVSEGSVVENPEGQEAGTYIKLVLANSSDVIYINAKDLIDVYTAAADATKVQLAVNGTEISASVVAGSIEKTDLTTAVQTSLGKADSAVQSVAQGTANGTIAVDGTDVAVKGLGSAAYTDASAYATTTDITNAINALDAEVSSQAPETGKGIKVTVTENDGKVSAVTVDGNFDSKYDAAGSATSALNSAKAYTDAALTWGTISE